jgi:type II secretory pathway component PulF
MKVLTIVAISLVLLCQVLMLLVTTEVLPGLARTYAELSIPASLITDFFLFFSAGPAVLVHTFPLILSCALALRLLLKRTGQTRDPGRYLLLITAFALIQTVATMLSFMALLAPIFTTLANH